MMQQRIETSWGETVVVTDDRAEAIALSRSEPNAVFLPPEIDELIALGSHEEINRAVTIAKRVTKGWLVPRGSRRYRDGD